MFISVLICSDSRSASLRRTLESLLSPANLSTPEWEVLVVMDDGRADGTAEVCRDFERRFPGVFRFLVQNDRGKSNALNLAIASARGDVLAMTDDDVLCAPEYLQGIRSVFADRTLSGAQGRILVDCEGGLPQWMSAEHKGTMSVCDRGEQVKPWTYSAAGTNMVVRAEAARGIGGFAPELGPGAAGMIEDTEFSLWLLRAGHKFIYAPQILVRHQLSRDRLTRGFFRKRYFNLGRSDAYRSALEVPLWRFGLYVVKNWAVREIQALYHRYAGRPAEALECQCEARLQAGFLLQHWRFRRGLPRQLSRVTSWPAETVDDAVVHRS